MDATARLLSADGLPLTHSSYQPGNEKGDRLVRLATSRSLRSRSLTDELSSCRATFRPLLFHCYQAVADATDDWRVADERIGEE